MGSCKVQRHVHEVIGSVKIAEATEDPHNHRFVGMTGEAILINNGTNHIHKLETTTDFYEDHYHDIDVRVGKAIPIADGKHVHYVYAYTEVEDGHRHEFIVATLIDNPIGD